MIFKSVKAGKTVILATRLKLVETSRYYCYIFKVKAKKNYLTNLIFYTKDSAF